ncbi:MAG: hypothetical protein BroJett011_42450 [Chloroflexota bacterium]|nr:MAG: hypothetical protein BroJett011_42450 [Chloroflexota bacterium]
MQYSKRFLIITTLFVTALLTSNIISVKLVSSGSFILPAGMIIFSIDYIFGDVLIERYGYKLIRPVIRLGLFCKLLMVAVDRTGQILSPAPFWPNQAAYEIILGNIPRPLLTSVVASLVGEFTNSCILARLKVMTMGQWLWLRTISSTGVGQGLYSLCFVSRAFARNIPQCGRIEAIGTQWLSKAAYEALASSLAYAAPAG